MLPQTGERNTQFVQKVVWQRVNKNICRLGWKNNISSNQSLYRNLFLNKMIIDFNVFGSSTDIWRAFTLSQNNWGGWGRETPMSHSNETNHVNHAVVIGKYHQTVFWLRTWAWNNWLFPRAPTICANKHAKTSCGSSSCWTTTPINITKSIKRDRASRKILNGKRLSSFRYLNMCFDSFKISHGLIAKTLTNPVDRANNVRPCEGKILECTNDT